MTRVSLTVRTTFSHYNVTPSRSVVFGVDKYKIEPESIVSPTPTPPTQKNWIIVIMELCDITGKEIF